MRCTRLWISSIPATSGAKRGDPVTLADLSPKRTDMDALCPLVESSTDTAHDRLTLGAILRAFLPALLHLLKLGNHKVRVLWHLAACGTPALGANLFACPHCPHRHWAPRSCGDRHCPRCLAAKSWQWLEKQTRSLLPIPYYHCVFTLPAELNPKNANGGAENRVVLLRRKHLRINGFSPGRSIAERWV